MKILVTGASGFIGGALLRRVRADGTDRAWGLGRRPLDDADYRAVDLTRPFDLPWRPDVVVHAAARAAPWGSATEFRRQNVDATRHVLAYCERVGRPKLVYVSSSSVFYRHEHQLGLTESSPIGPTFVNDYAATKAAGETLVRGYAGPWVIARPRAVFGPGDTTLFPRILAAARRGRLPLFVADGPPAIGDLIYIDALVEYLYRLATRPDLVGDFNLTNGEPVAIQPFLLDVLGRLGIATPARRVRVATAMRAAGVVEAAYRLLHLPGEPPVTRFGVSVFAYSKTFDVRRAMHALGPPSVTLEDGVQRFVDWQRAR